MLDFCQRGIPELLQCALLSWLLRSYLTSLSDPQGQPRPQKFKFSTVSLCFPEWMTDVDELRPPVSGSDSEEAEADTRRLEAIMRSHAAAGLANIGRPEVTQHGASLPVRAASLTMSSWLNCSSYQNNHDHCALLSLHHLFSTLGNWITPLPLFRVLISLLPSFET